MSTAGLYGPPSVAEIKNALGFVDYNSDREYWSRIAMAIKSELFDDGFSVFNEWSAQATDYDASSAKDTWKSVDAGGGIGIGTLFYEARKNGYVNGSKAEPMSEEAQAEYLKKKDEAAKKLAAEKRAKYGRGAKRANLLLEEAEIATDDHPYLVRKNVRAHGLKIGEWPVYGPDGKIFKTYPNTLFVPMYDITTAKAKSLQGIHEGGEKTFLQDGNAKGQAHIIGTAPDVGGTFYICEGYATGATIHELTGACVIVAFSAGNILEVAQKARQHWDKQSLIIAADDDRWKDQKGEIKNPGIHYATEAAKLVGAHVLVPTFKDDSSKPTDFNDLLALEGPDVTRAMLLSLNVKPPKSAEIVPVEHDIEPFRILGYDRDSFYFFQNEKSQVVEWNKSDMTETGFMSLAPLEYWLTNFPAKIGFNKSAAIDWTIRKCYQAGIYDSSRIRGRGAWIDEGRVVFHFGDRISVDGDVHRVTDISSRYVYEKKRSLPKPADIGLTDEEGRDLVDIAKRFRWSKPASAALMTGFIVLAPLCGALRWRPHIWITGGAGSGKSTTLEHLNFLMGGMNIFAQGNSTEAGFRQTLQSDALPVLFDEAESQSDNEAKRVQNVLSLIRQASTESAAQTLKGTMGGSAMNFHIRSMFCLSSIQVGIKHQADFERMTVLALRPKHEDESKGKDWPILRDKLHRVKCDTTLPARILRRSLDLMPITMQNMTTFQDAATEVFGSARDGDQYGTLMAGCWSLMHKHLATAVEAIEFIRSYEWDEYTEYAESDDPKKALGALMQAAIRTNSNNVITLHECVKAAHGGVLGHVMLPQFDAQDLLMRHGMMIKDDALLISNDNPAMSVLLKDTSYAVDWRAQLLRVPGVTRYPKAVRFNGLVKKSISVSLLEVLDVNF